MRHACRQLVENLLANASGLPQGYSWQQLVGAALGPMVGMPASKVGRQLCPRLGSCQLECSSRARCMLFVGLTVSWTCTHDDEPHCTTWFFLVHPWSHWLKSSCATLWNHTLQLMLLCGHHTPLCACMCSQLFAYHSMNGLPHGNALSACDPCQHTLPYLPALQTALSAFGSGRISDAPAYTVFGAAVAEVEVDVLTGDRQVGGWIRGIPMG